jgi:adenylate cyclase
MNDVAKASETTAKPASETPGASAPRRGPGRLRRTLKRWFGFDRLIALALLGVLLVLRASDPYPLQLLRVKTFDFYQKTKPRIIPPPEQKLVTIVDLDEKSLAEIGQWPWPRTIIAQMVQNLMQMGAVLVAFDIVFAEPDRMSPGSVAGVLPGLDAETRAKLEGLPSNDQVFAEVIKRSRVVLGQAGYWYDHPLASTRPPVRKSVAFKGPKPHAHLPQFPSLVRNVEVLEKAAAGHGIFSLVAEPDGIVRRVPGLFRSGDDLYPALSIEMLRVATGRPTLLAETNQAGVAAIGVTKGLKLPTDANGRIWPYFSASDKAKYVSARDILAGTVDPALIKGKLTIVGTSAVGLLDIRSTPTEPIMPGVEVHAQLIEAAAAGAYLVQPNYILAAELTLLLVGGLLMIVLVPLVGARWTMILFAAVSGGAAYTSWYLFAEQRILFDAGYAVISILLLYTTLTYTGYAKEEAQRRQVREAFSFYLSPAMVERLAADPGQLKLGGEKRDMTMLFCDVRGFTTISEMFDAEGLTRLINRLLTPLTDVILRRQGTVDKYMGDCIMAFWNAPLDDPAHGRNAVVAALEMNASMGPLNETLAGEAATEGRRHVPLKIGIGVNSGEVVVGNMGSDQRFDYSVLGDNVNLASRLEGQCKTYGVDLTVGENTYARAPGLAYLELDLIKVKGKTEAVRIYTVLGDEQVAAGAVFQALAEAHGRMLAAYRGQRWAEARTALAECRNLKGDFHLDGFYDVYEERLADYEANPPGAEWDGVYVAKTK